MAASNRTLSTAPRSIARAGGASEANFVQAFLMDLEHQGLVESAPSNISEGAPGSDGQAQVSRPADIENAVRKLIAVLKEAS
jgi:hypothetical protein